ncbi:MAG: DsbA family protein [Acetobacteraceae bacterium]
MRAIVPGLFALLPGLFASVTGLFALLPGLFALVPGLVASLAVWSLVVAGPAHSQGLSAAQRAEVVGIVREALKSDPSILREAITALQADDVRQQEGTTRDVLGQLGAKLVDAGDPVAGNPLGDVTIVEFYDTRCPYCRRMLPTMAELVRSDPKVRVVYKDWPILGPASQLESRALLAAQRQGGYFKLQERLMQETSTPTRDSLREAADQVGLEGGRLLRDMDEPSIKSRIEANFALAQQIGLQGTPALIVGQRVIGGAAELGELREAVAAARSGTSRPK